MASTPSSEPERRNNLTSTIKIATRLLLISALALVALCLLTVPTHPVHASSGGSLQLGSIAVQSSITCPGGQWLHGMTCFPAVLTGCQNVDQISFTFGQLIPTGTVKGVVVYFDGGDGITAAAEATELSMLQYYVTQSYAVVEIAWSSPWEQTTNANIQNAACRPATFLSYVYNGIYQSISTGTGGNSGAGMCAQGFSAGSTAIAYALAYYGAGLNLDAVELISGPVTSDINQGCEQSPPAVTVCGSGQYGCQLGVDTPWTLPPTYVENAVNYINSWTNSNTCTTGSNPKWLAQSIVDQNAGATPTFSYPNTAMSAWLCSTVQNPQGINCATGYQPDFCPNNSSSQGEIFYNEFTSINHPPVYNVYSVDNCFGPEGVPQGSVSALSKLNNNPPIIAPGDQSIRQDMTAHCAHPTR